MGLTMSEKRALTDQVVRRYHRAGKKEKRIILGECVQTTGYQRKYAIHLLNSWGRTHWVRIDGKPVKLVVGRPRHYDQEVLKALKQIWYVFDCMCCQRPGGRAAHHAAGVRLVRRESRSPGSASYPRKLCKRKGGAL